MNLLVKNFKDLKLPNIYNSLIKKKKLQKNNFSEVLNNEYYSKSLRFGFLEGSPERSPKINKETKKITVV